MSRPDPAGGRPTGPTFSVLTPVFDPVPEHLAACLASVAGQRLPDGVAVEHVVVDDASTDPRIASPLDEAASQRNVRVVRRPTNGGIVAASTDALAEAAGEWIVMLDHDDEMAPGALAAVAAHAARHPDTDVIYSDHDMIRPDGRYADPAYKPDLSPERLRQTNYITHLLAVRRSAAIAVGGFRNGTDGAQDHDLLLRLLESGSTFDHLPEILAHWRQSPRSVATDAANKPGAFDAGVAAVAAHVERSGIDATVTPGPFPGVYRIRRRSLDDTLVSVVIPTIGSSGRVWGVERAFVVDAVRSIAARSTHRRLEFVLVADPPTPDRVLADVERIAARHGLAATVVPFTEPFNFSRKVNAGIDASAGDLVLVLNDDTELIDPDSIGAMASLLSGDGPDRDIGAVGAKLLFDDGTLQHGGHVYHGEFLHACLGWPGEHPGPHRMFVVERECAGVTGAALMTPRRVIDAVGGFPDDLPNNFNDVDWCLTVREHGYRIIWTPYASWYHFEGRTRDRRASMAEWERVARRWPDATPHDPYSNPNLAPKRGDWLELPGRSGAPPYVIDADGVKRWG